MPVFDPKKRVYLRSLGIDPDQVDEIDEAESNSIPTQPTSNVVKPNINPFGAARREFIRSALPAVAGSSAAAFTWPIAAGLAPTTGGASIAIPFIASALAGVGTAAGTRYAQEKVLPKILPQSEGEKYIRQQQEDIEQQKLATTLGGIGANLVGGFKPNIRNLLSVPGTVKTLAKGVKPSVEELANLANISAGAGLPTAISVGGHLARGEEIDPLYLALDMLGGALFSEPNIIGRNIFGFHPSVRSKKTEAETIPVKSEITPSKTTPIETEPISQYEQELARLEAKEKPEIGALTELENQVKAKKKEAELLKQIASAEAASQKQATVLAKQYKRTDAAIAKHHGMEPEFWDRLSEESRGQLRELYRRDVAQRKLEEEYLKTPIEEQERAKQPSKIEAGDIEEQLKIEEAKAQGKIYPKDLPTESEILGEERPSRYAEGDETLLDKQQESELSKLASERLKPLVEGAKEKGVSLVPDSEWHNFFRRLGVLRNTKLTKEGKIFKSDGTEVKGEALVREGLQEAVAKINPDLATIDTWPHELFHIFFDDYGKLKGGNPILAKKALKAVEENSTYQQWKEARLKQNKAGDPEEYLTTLTGEDSVRNLLKTDSDGSITRFFKDFWANIKSRFGKGKPEDFARLMSNKLLYDAPFHEIYGVEDITGGAKNVKLSESEEKKPDRTGIPGIESAGNEPIFSFEKGFGGKRSLYINFLTEVKKLSLENAIKKADVIYPKELEIGEMRRKLAESDEELPGEGSAIPPTDKRQIKEGQDLLDEYIEEFRKRAGIKHTEANKQWFIGETEKARELETEGESNLTKAKELNITKARSTRQAEDEGEGLPLGMSKTTPISENESSEAKISIESHSTPWGIKLLTPRFDKIAERFNNATGNYVSKQLNTMEAWRSRQEGQIANKGIQLIRNSTLSKESFPSIVKHLWKLDNSGLSKVSLGDKQKSFVQDFIIWIREPRNLQIKEGLLVKGATGFRTAGVKEDGYFPNMLDPQVAYEWAEGGANAKTYDELYVKHRMSKGESEIEARKVLQEYKVALGHEAVPNLEFGALRKAEGLGLPFELVDKNLGSVMVRYGRRASKDLAFYKFIQKDRKMLKALNMYDQYGKRVEPGEEKDIEDISSAEETKKALRSVFDIDATKLNERINAFSRVAANTVMGIGTAARNVATMPTFLAPYVKISQLPLLAKALIKMNDSAKRAFENNAIRSSFADFDTAGDFVNHPDPMIRRLSEAAYILRKYQGRELADKMEGWYYFTLGELLAKDNLASAKNGDKGSMDFIKRFGDTIDGGYETLLKENTPITEDHIGAISKRFVDAVRGTYGPEGLPSSVIEGIASPFLALSRFNIEKANTIWKDVMVPLKRDKNWGPLVKLLFAGILDGAAIEALNELLTNKRGPDPTINEALKSNNTEEIVAKTIGLLQLSSAAGIITDAAKLGSNALQGKSVKYVNPLSFPLYSLGQEVVINNTVDMLGALREGEDFFDVFASYLTALGTQGVQTYRYFDANITRPEEAKRKERFRDIRTFQEMSGEREHGSPEHQNVIGRSKLKEFKRTGDIEKAKELLPDLLKTALIKSEGDSEKLSSELEKIKKNQYATIPNPSSMPGSFKKYIEFLVETQGVDNAKERLLDYINQNLVNKEKAKMIP